VQREQKERGQGQQGEARSEGLSLVVQEPVAKDRQSCQECAEHADRGRTCTARS
jgi:hypothetical protein